jgi:integrase
MDMLHINQGREIVDPITSDLTKLNSKVKSNIPKYWDKDFINSKVDLIQNITHKTLFFFLWRTGVRISEALSVRKKDINMDNYTVEIRWLKNRRYESRNIPLHPELRNILGYYITTMKAEDKIFPFSRQRADQLAKKYFEGNCHKFRHSFAVNWLICKGDIVTLHRILGHANIKTTMEYLKIIPTDQKQELEKIIF